MDPWCKVLCWLTFLFLIAESSSLICKCNIYPCNVLNERYCDTDGVCLFVQEKNPDDGSHVGEPQYSCIDKKDLLLNGDWNCQAMFDQDAKCCNDRPLCNERTVVYRN